MSYWNSATDASAGEDIATVALGTLDVMVGTGDSWLFSEEATLSIALHSLLMREKSLDQWLLKGQEQ